MWAKSAFLAFSILALSAASTGCTGGEDPALSPKKQLERYISMSFSVTRAEDRGELAKYLVGPALERLSAWNDAEFKQAFIESKRKFHSLVVRQITAISEDETNIIYDLSYFDKGGEYESKVTNSKLAQLVRVDKRWLIKDVRNIKELVEYKDALSLP